MVFCTAPVRFSLVDFAVSASSLLIPTAAFPKDRPLYELTRLLVAKYQFEAHGGTQRTTVSVE